MCSVVHNNDQSWFSCAEDGNQGHLLDCISAYTHILHTHTLHSSRQVACMLSGVGAPITAIQRQVESWSSTSRFL